jgi:hypothetical protein
MPLKRTGAVGSAVGTAVLAVLLLRGPALGPSAPSPKVQNGQSRSLAKPGQRKTKPAETKPQPLPEDGPWKASQAHFAGQVECPPSSVNNPRQDVWCIPSKEQVQAMIAIAPDPVNTHMALLFDRSVEALQLAAESKNYVVDRYWLPWDASPQPVWNDYESYQTGLNDQEEKEKQPGLLLFRWNGDVNTGAAKVLYVFVVSDTATAGVNGEQFKRAVQYQHDVCGHGAGCSRPDPIRIMGPTFSGSLASLVQLTESGNFIAYSGTVSSSAAIENQHLNPGNGHLKFQTFVGYTESAIKAFLQSLQESKDIQCDTHTAPQVALLSETATAYGTTASFLHQTPKDDDAAKRTEPEKAPTVLSVSCATSYSYPREISNLRNAYQASLNTAAGSQSSGVTSPYLSFNLADREPNKSDEPPDFSTPQGPLSKEAVLMKLAGELQRNQYKYIGVNGTNVLDVLFLASFLRSACPDARLFIINSDLLFDRNLDNAPYIGTLSVTTYPLLARNLDWTTQYGNAPRLPFADQYEEGQYNAFLATLRETFPDQNQPPFYEIEEPFKDTKKPFSFDAKTAPFWLTAVGTGGYWPVRLLGAAADSVQKPELKSADFSAAWKILLTLLWILAFFHVYVLLTVSPLSRRFRDFAVVTAMPTQRLFFVHLASATLALALAGMVFPVWKFGWEGGPHVLVMTVVAAVLVVALFGTCWWLHANCLARARWMDKVGKKDRYERVWPHLFVLAKKLNITGMQRKAFMDRARTWFPILLALLVWISLFALGGMWSLLFLDDPTHYGFFFAYRSVHLATGVSPYTPMIPLLATIYCWSILEVWRLRFNDLNRPRLMLSRSLPGGRTEKSIARAVGRFLLGSKYVIAFLVVFAFWLALFDFTHPFRLFEKPVFSRVYAVLFSIAVAMMLASGLRLWEVWSWLRDLLRELERSPLRQAFSRLKGFGWSPIWRQGGEEAELINMARSLEAIRQIKNCAGTVKNGPKLNGDITEMEANVKRIRWLAQEGQDRHVVFASRLCHSEYKQPLQSFDLNAAEEPKDRQALRKQPFVGLVYGFGRNLAGIQQSFANILKRILDVLKESWETRCLKLVEDEDMEKSDATVIVMKEPEEADPEEKRREELEEYAALRYVAFIRGVLYHMRHLIIFLAVSFSLIMIALNVYSFEPHQTLIWSFTAIFCIVGFMIVLVLAQVHRDHILSRVTGTKANELGLPFYIRIISFGAVPVLTLLATHFPAIGHYLLSFLQPGLESLK